MQVATYNIRNVRAIDPSSWWWFRRRRLREVVGLLDVDLWAFQEAYPSQISHIADRVLPAPAWGVVGRGRNPNGGGEAAVQFHRRSMLRHLSDTTRWFGPTPDCAGSRMPDARHPRIVTITEYAVMDGVSPLTVAGLHLDSDSVERRAASLEQLAEWMRAAVASGPTIVLGDFNGPRTEPGFGALTRLGLRSVLPDDAGPTSNGFGRHIDEQQQIDHIFVSDHYDVVSAGIVTDAGHASDHYPVVAHLELA